MNDKYRGLDFFVCQQNKRNSEIYMTIFSPLKKWSNSTEKNPVFYWLKEKSKSFVCFMFNVETN